MASRLPAKRVALGGRRASLTQTVPPLRLNTASAGFLAVRSLPATSLDRARTALTFSLWAWAAYWPAMGLMLLLGGMRDPVSLVVVALSAGCFALFASMGALRATSSRSMREFLLERPFYLVAALLLFLTVGAAIPALANIGLGLFSGTFLASLGLLAWRLVAYVQESGLGVFRARADQALLLLAIAIPAAAMVFFDSLRLGGVGNGGASVAMVNWLCLAYPALLLLATRPLREPLRLARPKAARAPAEPVAFPTVE